MSQGGKGGGGLKLAEMLPLQFCQSTVALKLKFHHKYVKIKLGNLLTGISEFVRRLEVTTIDVGSIEE